VTLPHGTAKAGYVRAMFERIAARYDLLNDLMTAGQHRHWKRLTVRAAEPRGALALDLGCGTGDLSRELARQGARFVVGGDFVPVMLRQAADKTARCGPQPVTFAVADALALPFPSGTFDCVTSGFLVRNVVDQEAAFQEMLRVLRPGGRVVCLEATRRDGVTGRLLNAGFGIVARLLGRFVAGDPAAYAYLPDSAAAFASPPELAATMQCAGFTAIQYRTLGLGLIAIHRGRKPAEAREALGA
jgi:demethylmenaquinone methyltransferase/2-methoxy-6-polyprenyl-1,4-benzoquinol methylase